jgi:hypothetical protein
MIKGEDYSFHQTYADQITYNKNKRSFSINPFVPHSSRIRKILFEFEFVHLESGFFYLYLFIYLLIFIFFFCFILYFISIFCLSLSFFYSLPSFLKSHSFDPVESDPFSHREKGTKSIRLIFRSKVICEIFGFFPLPLSLSHRYSVWINREPFLLFCMNRYYYIPILSRYLPRKIPNWIQKKLTGWCELIHAVMHSSNQIGIHFLKDSGFRALMSRPRSFRWPMLCWRDIYMIRSIA